MDDSFLNDQLAQAKLQLDLVKQQLSVFQKTFNSNENVLDNNYDISNAVTVSFTDAIHEILSAICCLLRSISAAVESYGEKYERIGHGDFTKGEPVQSSLCGNRKPFTAEVEGRVDGAGRHGGGGGLENVRSDDDDRGTEEHTEVFNVVVSGAGECVWSGGGVDVDSLTVGLGTGAVDEEGRSSGEFAGSDGGTSGSDTENYDETLEGNYDERLEGNYDERLEGNHDERLEGNYVSFVGNFDEITEKRLIRDLYQTAQKSATMSLYSENLKSGKNIDGHRRGKVRENCDDTAKIKENMNDVGFVCAVQDSIRNNCCFCSKTFPTELDLQKHWCVVDDRLPRRKFPCLSCSALFPSYNKWFRHQRLSHVRVTCEVCDDVFDGLRGLNVHARRHMGHSDERRFCRICDRFYFVSAAIHNTMLHSGIETVACPLCSEVFSDDLELERHRSRAHASRAQPDGGFRCPVCERAFKNKLALNVHRSSHATKRYSCKICGKRFLTSVAIEQHKHRHEGPDLACSLCKKTFTTRHFLAKHVKSHARVDRYDCKICGKALSSRSNMNSHLAVHSEKTFACSICAKKFSSNPRKNRHELSHSNTRTIVCPDCGKTVATPAALRSHRFHMHSSERPIFKCEKCDKTFRSVSGYKEHQRTHGGVKSFVCDECGRCFYDSRSLRMHQRVHTGEKPFHCDICGVDFAHGPTLRGHKRLHTGVKSSICAVCGKAFLDNARLAVHMKIHSTTKDQYCQLCDKFYTNLACLKIHVSRMHNGIKPAPYVCSFCPRSFPQSSHRDAHVRSAHTGERPFACTDCDKSFVSNGDLKKHSRRHTGERPYVCDVCSRTFSYASVLRKHKVTHTKAAAQTTEVAVSFVS